jgi:thioesterase domain-containing protein
VAFEAARLLTERGRRVALLALLDTDFPDALLSVRWLYTSSPAFQRRIYPLIQRVRSHAAVLGKAGISGYWSTVLKQGAAPLAAIDDARDQHAPVPKGLAEVIRRNQRADRFYIPRRYDGDILLLRARDRDTTQDRRDRWCAVARTVENVIVPGDHYTMRMEPHAAAAAAVITARMNGVEAMG